MNLLPWRKKGNVSPGPANVVEVFYNKHDPLMVPKEIYVNGVEVLAVKTLVRTSPAKMVTLTFPYNEITYTPMELDDD